MIELIILALVALIIASYSDIRTREVPDWLSYGLIFAGFGFRLIYSASTWNLDFIVEGVLGFLLFLIIGYIMFYAGQWGGGDSKLLMGLGALIGINLDFSRIPFLASFLINVIIVGALYGLIYSIIIAFVKYKSFLSEFKKLYKNPIIKKARNYLLVSMVLLFALAFFIDDFLLKLLFFTIIAMSFLTYLVWMFVKAVEKGCMHKFIEPTKLTEGDWIVKDIHHNGKRITGPKDLGIEKPQIEILIKLYKQNKIGKVLIKEGIPFVPSFLVGYLITLFFGNILLWFI